MARDPLRGDWLAISRSRELYALWSDEIGRLELSVLSHASRLATAEEGEEVRAGDSLASLDDRRRSIAARAALRGEQLRLLAFGRGVTLAAALTTAFATPAGYVVADVVDDNP